MTTLRIRDGQKSHSENNGKIEASQRELKKKKKKKRKQRLCTWLINITYILIFCSHFFYLFNIYVNMSMCLYRLLAF